jgi:hypothetical protein
LQDALFVIVLPEGFFSSGSGFPSFVMTLPSWRIQLRIAFPPVHQVNPAVPDVPSRVIWKTSAFFAVLANPFSSTMSKARLLNKAVQTFLRCNGYAFVRGGGGVIKGNAAASFAALQSQLLEEPIISRRRDRF